MPPSVFARAPARRTVSGDDPVSRSRTGLHRRFLDWTTPPEMRVKKQVSTGRGLGFAKQADYGCRSKEGPWVSWIFLPSKELSENVLGRNSPIWIKNVIPVRS